MKVKIYHNPRCSKSRETLKLLQDKGVDIEIIEYLKNPPSRNEITTLLKKLKIKAVELIRTKEKLYKDTYKDQNLDEKKLIEIMHKNPVLIERPIVVAGNKAVIGRPPENINNLL